VYTNRGPIDPYPFIHNPGKAPGDLAPKDLKVHLQLKPKKLRGNVSQTDSTLLVPLAVNEGGYIAEFPDGRIVQAPFSSVKIIKG
jgi:hypothetical protein